MKTTFKYLSFAILWGFFCQRAIANLPDFTQLVEQNSPAVVNISTTQNYPLGQRSLPNIPELQGPVGDLLKRLLKGQQRGQAYKSYSMGSGFIISADGYIVTNHHVVKDVDEILVKLNDQREFKATVIGSDKDSDIALLKIKATHLPIVKIGQSQKLKAGEWVLAIGSPFGYDSSVTAGIVSATRRAIPGENYIPFIQTDVAINPGNSGGPLFNLKGEVIGVNSQIYSKSGGYMGISFSVPIEMAMNVVNQLKTKGRFSRGWLGVLIQNVPKDLAQSFGLNRARGALIGNVIENSPAETAGLQQGDIILKYNQHIIEHSADLPPFVGSTIIGESAIMQVWRNDKEIQLTIRIEELPNDNTPVSLAKPKRASTNRLGLTISPVTENIRRLYKMRQRKGVYINNIQQGAAQEAGIQKGDVIVMMANKPIISVHDFNQQVKQLRQGSTVAVLLIREGEHHFMALHVPK